VNNFYVYEHWRLDRDECFYVGKGKGRRAYKMQDRNRHHAAIQAKVAREGSAIEVRIVASGLAENAAFALERERICFWRKAGIDLTNISAGGDGHSGVPAFNRRSVLCLEDNKLFVSATSAAFNYNVSSVSVSDVCRKKYRSINSIHFIYHDRQEPSEWREKAIKEIEEECAARRKKVKNPKTFFGSSSGKDVKGRIATGPMQLSKKVLCVTHNKEFPSASEAARHYSLCKSSIIELCLGKNNRKSVGGLVFKYLESA
jgi:hypothetical protein